MGTYLLSDIGGNVPLSRFLGFWSVMGEDTRQVNPFISDLKTPVGYALFAFIGTELVIWIEITVTTVVHCSLDRCYRG